MKIKTSITISKEILHSVDKYTGEKKNRSEFIEKAIRSYINQLIRDEQNAKDLEILNNNAERLNQEAEEVLMYQVEL
jgi:metal-responsive CopG/Arc/MetJ family transcriptional regulator